MLALAQANNSQIPAAVLPGMSIAAVALSDEFSSVGGLKVIWLVAFRDTITQMGRAAAVAAAASPARMNPRQRGHSLGAGTKMVSLWARGNTINM
jgi:hypothetical protein